MVLSGRPRPSCACVCVCDRIGRPAQASAYQAPELDRLRPQSKGPACKRCHCGGPLLRNRLYLSWNAFCLANFFSFCLFHWLQARQPNNFLFRFAQIYLLSIYHSLATLSSSQSCQSACSARVGRLLSRTAPGAGGAVRLKSGSGKGALESGWTRQMPNWRVGAANAAARRWRPPAPPAAGIPVAQ